MASTSARINLVESSIGLAWPGVPAGAKGRLQSTSSAENVSRSTRARELFGADIGHEPRSPLRKSKPQLLI